jgi:hypothetical protein
LHTLPREAGKKTLEVEISLMSEMLMPARSYDTLKNDDGRERSVLIPKAILTAPTHNMFLAK